MFSSLRFISIIGQISKLNMLQSQLSDSFHFVIHLYKNFVSYNSDEAGKERPMMNIYIYVYSFPQYLLKAFISLEEN